MANWRLAQPMILVARWPFRLRPARSKANAATPIDSRATVRIRERERFVKQYFMTFSMIHFA
jgi:hypothetical protein